MTADTMIDTTDMAITSETTDTAAEPTDLLDGLFDVPLAALCGPVNPAALREALAAASCAPSAANLQPWMFYVLTSPGARRAVAERALNALGLPMKNHRNHALEGVPVLVMACTDVLRAKCRFGDRGRDLFAVQDVAVAIHNVRLAALRAGIFSHWMRELDFSALSHDLKLAPRFAAQAVIAFGLTHTTELERPPRLPFERVVRWEEQE